MNPSSRVKEKAVGKRGGAYSLACAHCLHQLSLDRRQRRSRTSRGPDVASQTFHELSRNYYSVPELTAPLITSLRVSNATEKSVSRVFYGLVCFHSKKLQLRVSSVWKQTYIYSRQQYP